jgi:hypothetical protein
MGFVYGIIKYISRVVRSIKSKGVFNTVFDDICAQAKIDPPVESRISAKGEIRKCILPAMKVMVEIGVVGIGNAFECIQSIGVSGIYSEALGRGSKSDQAK